MWLPIKFCTLINTDYSFRGADISSRSVVITYQILYIDQYWLQQKTHSFFKNSGCDYLSNFVHWSILITACGYQWSGEGSLWLPIKFCTLINTDYSIVDKLYLYNTVVITYQILYIDQYWLQLCLYTYILRVCCDYLSNFVHWSILITAKL